MAHRRVVAWSYGLGRVGFGVGLLAAPRQAGSILVGRRPDTDAAIAWRAFGSRDLVLGAGILHGLRRGGHPTQFLAASVASDILDVVGQSLDWRELEPGRRSGGVSLAAAAALARVVAMRGKE